MEKVRVIHDVAGQTMTVWLDDPAKEHICEETTEEVVLMKDKQGKIIGFELLHYRQEVGTELGLSVETVVRSGT